MDNKAWKDFLPCTKIVLLKNGLKYRPLVNKNADVAIHRIYWKGEKKVSAVLSKVSDKVYYWEIYPIRFSEHQRFTGPDAETTMEAGVMKEMNR